MSVPPSQIDGFFRPPEERKKLPKLPDGPIQVAVDCCVVKLMLKRRHKTTSRFETNFHLERRPAIKLIRIRTLGPCAPPTIRDSIQSRHVLAPNHLGLALKRSILPSRPQLFSLLMSAAHGKKAAGKRQPGNRLPQRSLADATIKMAERHLLVSFFELGDHFLA